MERRGSANWGMWCIPTDVSSFQIVEVVRQHIAEQPQTGEDIWDEIVVASALIKAWPCKLG
jgi:hypothetical protein